MNEVARLIDLHDSTGRHIWRIDLSHSLVEMVVEFFTHWVETTQAVALEKELKQIRAMSISGTHWDRVLFSAKESIYKAWYPIAKKWLGFKDAQLTFHPESHAFQASLLVPGPIVNGRQIESFDGRYAIENGFVLTAVSLAACPQSGKYAPPSK